MISSSRFRNSGRKWPRTTSITCGSTFSTSSPSPSWAMNWLPRLEVRMMIVLVKVDGAALTVGQTPVIQHLKEDVEDIPVCLFHFVEQDDLIRAAAEQLQSVRRLPHSRHSREGRRSAGQPNASP